MHNLRHVTGLGWGGDVNDHVNLRQMHNLRHVTGLGSSMLTCVGCTTCVTSLGWGGVEMLTSRLTCVACSLRHMHNLRHVTVLGWGC